MKEIPKESKADIIQKIIKGSVSGLPLAREFFEIVLKPPYIKRLDKWMASVAKDLKRLEEKVEEFNIKNLAENEVFITTVLHASQVAIRSHQKEKLEALRSAVLNSTLMGSPEENLQLMFLNFIDTFNPWHLKILKFLDSPEEWSRMFPFQYPDIDVTTPMHMFYYAFPKMRNQPHFINQLIEDLSLRGLLSKEELTKQMKKPAYFRVSHTKTLGKQFLHFITSPIKEE